MVLVVLIAALLVISVEDGLTLMQINSNDLDVMNVEVGLEQIESIYLTNLKSS